MGEGFLPGSGDKDVFPNGDALAFANASGAPDDASRADLESCVHGRPPSVPSSAWVLILTLPLASCGCGPVSASVSPAIKGRQSQHLPQGEVVGINKSIYIKHLKQLSTWWVSVGHRKQILVPACTSSRDKAKEGSRSPCQTLLSPGKVGRVMTGALPVASGSQACVGDLGRVEYKPLHGDSSNPCSQPRLGQMHGGLPPSLHQPPEDTSPGVRLALTGRGSNHPGAPRPSSPCLLAIQRVPRRSLLARSISLALSSQCWSNDRVLNSVKRIKMRKTWPPLLDGLQLCVCARVRWQTSLIRRVHP